MERVEHQDEESVAGVTARLLEELGLGGEGDAVRNEP
jgi:hypothetical protein